MRFVKAFIAEFSSKVSKVTALSVTDQLLLHVAVYLLSRCTVVAFGMLSINYNLAIILIIIEMTAHKAFRQGIKKNLYVFFT